MTCEDQATGCFESVWRIWGETSREPHVRRKPGLSGFSSNPVFQNAPDCAESVFPSDLLPLGIGAPVIRNGHLVDAPLEKQFTATTGESRVYRLPNTLGMSRVAALRLDDRLRSESSSASSLRGDSRTSTTRSWFRWKRSCCGWSGFIQWESRRFRPRGDLQSMRPYSSLAISS